jgi:hypothetical protein
MSSIRLRGILEQYERARFFLAEGKASEDEVARFRRLVAVIYFARAVVELMLECADKQEIAITRAAVESELLKRLPYSPLIERLRIHDFHRFGLLQDACTFLGGPVKITASCGGAELAISSNGIVKATSGSSRIEEHRSLLTRNGEVFDDEGQRWVRVEPRG